MVRRSLFYFTEAKEYSSLTCHLKAKNSYTEFSKDIKDFFSHTIVTFLDRFYSVFFFTTLYSNTFCDVNTVINL